MRESYHINLCLHHILIFFIKPCTHLDTDVKCHLKVSYIPYFWGNGYTFSGRTQNKWATSGFQYPWDKIIAIHHMESQRKIRLLHAYNNAKKTHKIEVITYYLSSSVALPLVSILCLSCELSWIACWGGISSSESSLNRYIELYMANQHNLDHFLLGNTAF